MECGKQVAPINELDVAIIERNILQTELATARALLTDVIADGFLSETQAHRIRTFLDSQLAVPATDPRPKPPRTPAHVA